MGKHMDTRWKASVERGLDHFDTEIRLAIVSDDGMTAAVAVEDGALVMEERARYAALEPLLKLPLGALEALRDALNNHAPPSSDADLRDALTVERERVDRIIGSLLDR